MVLRTGFEPVLSSLREKRLSTRPTQHETDEPGGPDRIRTCNQVLAKHPLYRWSYWPMVSSLRLSRLVQRRRPLQVLAEGVEPSIT